MSTKQPEALRLAKQLEDDWHSYETGQAMLEAASELVRLHNANVELINKLKAIDLCYDESIEMPASGVTNKQLKQAWEGVREALAKADGMNNE